MYRFLRIMLILICFLWNIDKTIACNCHYCFFSLEICLSSIIGGDVLEMCCFSGRREGMTCAFLVVFEVSLFCYSEWNAILCSILIFFLFINTVTPLILPLRNLLKHLVIDFELRHKIHQTSIKDFKMINRIIVKCLLLIISFDSIVKAFGLKFYLMKFFLETYVSDKSHGFIRFITSVSFFLCTYW